MAELPTGTVTMLFSDIEGSTMLLTRLGPAYVEALDGQREILRSAWAAHRGMEIGTEGDSFFVVFATATDAVAAAAQAQRELAAHLWPGGEQVQVRMGVHTGSPAVHHGGYVGMDVHRAARIAAAANGGQVVVSEATARLLDPTALGAGLMCRDLGSHRLKDIPAPEHLFQLDIKGLRADYPPLRSLGTTTSLPVPATPLVGRNGEVAELSALLNSSEGVRLVTLTGPGGSGKTRLAMGVAEQLTARFPGGVFFVPLATVTTAEVMWTTIADVMDAPPEGRIPPGFFTHVAHRSALFVLDNLEQLPGADAVVAELLQEAPQVVVIATSRRPLHLLGEYEHPVPPLELPEGPDFASVEAAGAVKMFVHQARRVRPSFRLSPDNAADVVAVCRRLDGLPLAIELVAARSKLLSPHALLSRLDTALDIRAADTQVPSRQKTLRDTIDWSYSMLRDQQQSFFRRLGVFAGGADLEAIQALTADVLDGADPLDLVGDLVDVSLLNVSDGVDGEPRISMLETVRAYARDSLRDAAELERVGEHHARFFLDLAESLGSPGERSHLERWAMFEAEHDNFREALNWMADPRGGRAPLKDKITLLLRLCVALGMYWQTGGYLVEARGWLERAVESAGGADSPELADSLRRLANILRFQGDVGRARTFATASVSMCRRLDDPVGLALSLIFLAAVESYAAPTGTTRRLYEEALTLARQTDHRFVLGFVLSDFSEFETAEHNYDAALELADEALLLSREHGSPHDLWLSEHAVARTLRHMGRLDEARDRMVALIPSCLAINNSVALTAFADDYGALLVDLGDLPRAVSLLAAADERRERLGTPRDGIEITNHADTVAKARRGMSVDEWEVAYQAGRSTTVEDALRDLHAAMGSKLSAEGSAGERAPHRTS
jgi:predicted ATPase/class 3 adenylate cyclase